MIAVKVVRAQRFALAAGGWDEIRSESRKNLKPEKCLKMR